MSNSSQQNLYSITLNPCNEITLDNMNAVTIDYGMTGDFTITSIPAISTVDINSFDTQYEINFGEEWSTHFPDFREVEKMCKEYPALEKAFDKFKTTYEMVKDDYASKTREQDQ